MAKEHQIDRALSPTEEAFCQAFANPESDTYDRQGLSGKKVGMSAPTVSRTLRKLHVQKRIREIYSGSEWTPERIMSNIRSNRQKADAKGDYATVCRCDELMAKKLGMLSDRMLLARDGGDNQRVLSEAEKQEAVEFALWRFDTLAGRHRLGAGGDNGGGDSTGRQDSMAGSSGNTPACALTRDPIPPQSLDAPGSPTPPVDFPALEVFRQTAS